MKDLLIDIGVVILAMCLTLSIVAPFGGAPFWVGAPLMTAIFLLLLWIRYELL